MAKKAKEKAIVMVAGSVSVWQGLTKVDTVIRPVIETGRDLFTKIGDYYLTVACALLALLADGSCDATGRGEDFAVTFVAGNEKAEGKTTFGTVWSAIVKMLNEVFGEDGENLSENQRTAIRTGIRDKIADLALGSEDAAKFLETIGFQPPKTKVERKETAKAKKAKKGKKAKPALLTDHDPLSDSFTVANVLLAANTLLSNAVIRLAKESLDEDGERAGKTLTKTWNAFVSVLESKAKTVATTETASENATGTEG